MTAKENGATSAIPFGLTKREYFAAMAVQGWLASFAPDVACDKKTTAEFAVDMADALLAALERKQ